MSIIEMEKIKFAEEKKREGKIEGKIEGVDLTLEIIHFLKTGLPANQIAKKLNTSIEIVHKIKKKINI